MNAQTHGVNRFSLVRQWSCSCCPATCQRTCVNQKWLMSLLYWCFVTFISTKAQHWTYYSACMLFVDVEPYRLTVLRHHWHCCICIYCHNIISSGSPPVFFECTIIMLLCFIAGLKIQPSPSNKPYDYHHDDISIRIVNCYTSSGCLLTVCTVCVEHLIMTSLTISCTSEICTSCNCYTKYSAKIISFNVCVCVTCPVE